MKKIAICGASGLVGSKLFERLPAYGQHVVVGGRDSARLRLQFPTASECIQWSEFGATAPGELNAIVNLAGAGVTDRRWSPKYKQTMTVSRVKSTQTCAKLAAEDPQIRLISASSVHAYGIYRNDHPPFVEGDQPRPGGEACYLHKLITAWEKAVQPAIDAGASVAMLRLGVVLAKDGWSLKAVLPAFRAFLGGRQVSGRQIISWISIDDVVAGIMFLLDRPKLNGPVNFVSPKASTNAEVMRYVGKALGRPSLLPMPSFLARLVLGDAANELILAGQRVEPKFLNENGFEFLDSNIESCLSHLLKTKSL